MRIPFDNLGRGGFIGDVLSHELPPEVWTGGRNVRMVDGFAEKMNGHTPVYGTPLVEPNWLLPVPTVIDYHWMYASKTKVGIVDSAEAHTNITREASPGVDEDYTGNLTINWNGGLLNGIPAINNGFDVPQMWNPPEVPTKLTALTAWDSTWRAKCLRPFKSFLFAMDMTENGIRYPHKVRWSHPADPNSVPVSWDATDPTKDAGFVTLSDTGGYVLDCLSLRDSNIVYKEDQVWGFQYVGGNQVFRPYKIFGETGMLSRDCAAAFFAQGLKHAVFGGDDLYVHDGNSATSIADKRVRRWLFNQLSSDSFQFCFVVPNYAQREIWFCFVPTGQTMITTVLPWSWEDNLFSMPRDLPSIRFAAAGLVANLGAGETWDGDAGAWDSDATLWDDRRFGAASRKVLFGAPTGQTIQYVDQTNQFAGANMTATLERVGLAFAKVARDGTPKADVSVRKLVKEVWPRIEASVGTVVNIYVGVHDAIEQPITWQGPFPFTVGTHKKVNCLASGRFIAVRFQSTTNVAWKLHSYELEIEPVGVYF